jgi:CheY-like chemotaxis protein
MADDHRSTASARMGTSTGTGIATTHRVAFDGFGEFEREMLTTFFRLADRRQPAYRLIADIESADWLVVDADDPRCVARVVGSGRVDSAVFVGAGAPDDAIARAPRPIEPVQILRELDQLVAQRRLMRGGDEPVDLLLDDAALPLLADAARAAAGALEPIAWTAGDGGGRAVLVVDDSPIARAFLDTRLRRLGYQVQLAASGEQALALAEQQAYAIVFLDVVLGGADKLDGLQVCRALKQRAAAYGQPAPPVLIVSGHGAATDRVRGSLVGCDAYLAKPLVDAELIAAIVAADPQFQVVPA